MALPSTSSASLARRGVKDDDVYVYSLQTAYLAQLLAQATSGEGARSDVHPPARRSLDQRGTARGGVTDRMKDMRVTSRTIRYPEKVLRKLTERLERIAMGREPQYSEALFRQTIGAFYSTMTETSTYKRLKENRDVEELLTLFSTSAQTSLKKRIQDEGVRKAELQSTLTAFVRLVRDAMRIAGIVPRELGERLDECAAAVDLDEPNARASSDSRRSDAAAPDPLVRAVGLLFHVDDDQLARDLDSVRPSSTSAAALVDLKRIIHRVHAQQAWPAQPADFTDDAYKPWRTAELSALSEMMVTLCTTDRALLGAAGRGARSATPNVPETVEDGELTFVPPDPPGAFQRLVERCMDQDLETIRSKQHDEEVAPSILSPVHVQLLDVCAERWRISSEFRALAVLRITKARFDCGEVPLAAVGDALGKVTALVQTHPVSAWRRYDAQVLRKTLDALADSLLRGVYTQYQAMEAAEASELRASLALVAQIKDILAATNDAGLSDASMKQLHELNEAIRLSAIQRYTEKTAHVFRDEDTPLLDASGVLLDWVETTVEAMRQKAWPTPMSISPVDVLIQKLVPLYLDDLDSMRRAILQQVLASASLEKVNDVLDLYRRVRALVAMYAATPSAAPLAFSLRRWFAPYVERWLVLSGEHASQWVQNALAADTFAPTDSETRHSTSINDLFEALQQPLRVLSELAWPNAYEQACFMTMLAKLYCQLMEQYCHGIEDRFMAEMAVVLDATPPSLGGFLEGPRAQEYISSLPPKQAAWVAKARQTMAKAKQIQPFLFQPESCVKLNNIEAARKLLDVLYQRMDADRQAVVVADHLAALSNEGAADDSVVSVSDERAPLHYLFSVKIVQAEFAVGSEAHARLDSFATLSDEHGHRLGKTRTIYDTHSPRWDEVFDIPSNTAAWVSCTVWLRRFGADPEVLGRASLRLDPHVFKDENSHEVQLTLDGRGGTVLARISMEHAHDDILFHFGRAFRVLKRSEVDMVRVLIDHMSLFMRQFLSRSVVHSLVGGGHVNLDRALNNVKALYASALAQASGQAALIPPVEAGRRRPAALSDQEIEAAIVPLLDYFEDTLGTLQSSLSEDQSQLVLTRVWKEVLCTLEAILVPPLSDAPTAQRQLPEAEVEIVFKWLSFLKSYFNAYDPETRVAHGVPLDILQGPKYRELLSYLLLQDQTTDELMVECVRGFQARLATSAPTAASKSLLNQRSLGTIRKHKRTKAHEDHAPTDMAMKILRMRPGTGDFLTQQLISMNSLQQSTARCPPHTNRLSRRLTSLLST